MEIKLSLRRKAPIFALGLVIIPMLAISLFFYARTREVLMETISVNNTSFTLSAARGIRDQTLSFINILESSVPSILMAETETEKKELLIGLKKGFVSISSLSILNSNGKEIIRSDDKELKDCENNPEFYIAKEEGFYLSWFEYNKEQELSSIIISVPMWEENNLKGVLKAEIFLYEIWNQAIISSLSLNDNCYIVTQEGDFVAKIITANESFVSPDLEEIAITSALNKRLFTEERETESGEMLIIASPIPVLNWELVVFRPTSEIYEPIIKIRNEVIVIGFFSLVLVSVAALLFSKKIVEPIDRLYRGAKIIGSGNLDHRVDIKSGDEIEELAKEFNNMVDGLKVSQAALEEERALLEIKVGARTRELEEFTESLEEKIKERTKELEKKLVELETFRKLTIDRELKMILLKKEIKKLKERDY